MGELTFTVPGEPHGKGSVRASLRGGGVHTYKNPKTVAYEDRVALFASRAARGMPIEGPVRVSIVAYRRRPKSPPRKHECRTGIEAGSHRWCTKKPDADNCAKSVLDGCTTAGVWMDDCQVADLRVSKFWCNEGEHPRTDVHIEVIQLTEFAESVAKEASELDRAMRVARQVADDARRLA